MLMVGLVLMVGCSATMTETKNYDANGKVVSSTLTLKDYTVTETAAGKKSYIPKSGMSPDAFTNLLKIWPIP